MFPTHSETNKMNLFYADELLLFTSLLKETGYINVGMKMLMEKDIESTHYKHLF